MWEAPLSPQLSSKSSNIANCVWGVYRKFSQISTKSKEFAMYEGFWTPFEKSWKLVFSHGYGRRNVDIFYQSSIETRVNAAVLFKFTKIEKAWTISVLESKSDGYRFFGLRLASFWLITWNVSLKLQLTSTAKGQLIWDLWSKFVGTVNCHPA